MPTETNPLDDLPTLSPRVERTQVAILDAVRTMVNTFGPRRLRIDDVVREAGVSRQTIANHFGTKDEVLRAWADNEHRMMAEVFLTTAAEGGDLEESFTRAATTVLDFLASQPSLQPPLLRDMVAYLSAEGTAFPDLFAGTLAAGIAPLTGADEEAALAAGQAAYRLLYSFATQPTDQLGAEVQARIVAQSLLAALRA